MPRLLAREEAALAEAIERSCANKAQVVAADEREGGIRAILNLGHTFGHAIETGQGYGQWLHGEAVATGMLLALELSARRGWVAASEVEDFAAMFLDLMAHDKKVIDGRLRLILLDDIGSACIVDDVTEAELQALLARP